jgi:serine/threonine-protein kinase
MTENLGPAPAPAIPGFEILERLGEGGMGVVFKARQVALDRWVAVKVLRDELQQEPEYIKRFFKEARLAGRLRHANIVSALDCGTAQGRSYMVMEYVEGKPLDRLLKSRGALPEPEALDIARGIAEALQYAWLHHLIHRDLKPQNVLLTKEGVPKVSDFGLCRDIRDLPHLTSLGIIHCTPEYSSPEQARGDRDIDVRADLYSLGVTLYEMLTGSLPFEASDPATMIVRHAMDRPRPPIERNGAISPQTNQLVLDLLEKAKEERPSAPAMVIERLKFASGSPRPSTSSSNSTSRRITRAWRGTQRRSAPAAPGPPFVAAIGVTVAGVILLGALVFRGGAEPRPTETIRLKPGPTVKPAPAVDVNVTPEELRQQNLARFLQAFQAGADGSVNHWLVLGPLLGAEDRSLDSPVARQAEGTDPIPGLEFARTDGVMMRWLRHEASDGTLDLSEALGLRDDATGCLALAACWLEVPENRSVEIRFSATGGYEFQLDRRVLAAAPTRSKGAQEPFRQKIVLGKGWHSILVKADRLEGRLAVQLRIVTPDGDRLPGLRVWH